jgi:hypothetical protein
MVMGRFTAHARAALPVLRSNVVGNMDVDGEEPILTKILDTLRVYRRSLLARFYESVTDQARSTTTRSRYQISSGKISVVLEETKRELQEVPLSH